MAALAWGSGDFGGGLLSRRIPVLAVVLMSQVVGTVIALIIAVLRGETMPLPSDIPLSVFGGVSGGIGIVALYHGLATARMGVVAPITGVLAAAMPVIYGMLIEGLPSPLVVGGIAVAIVAVILVSRISDEKSGPSGIGIALISGTAIGAFGIAISHLSEGHTFGPLAIIRTAEAAFVAGVIVIGQRSWRFDRRWLPAMAGVGVLDMAGNAAFILAVQTGALAIAAVLSSLYPVTTVILATVFLRERVTRSHAVGIILAVVAIVCIAAGSS